MSEYTSKEIAEFIKTMDYELGAQRYKPKDLIIDFCRSIVIAKQLTSELAAANEVETDLNNTIGFMHQQLDELRPYSYETVQGLIKWRDERIKQLENEMQKYIYVATMADCYVGLKPEHKLHESIRQDLLASLQALKGGE